MKKPDGFLANPPNRRRSTSFNITVGVLPTEFAAAAEELATLAPDGSTEVTWRLKAELRFRRTPEEPDRLAVQVSFEIAAVEATKG